MVLCKNEKNFYQKIHKKQKTPCRFRQGVFLYRFDSNFKSICDCFKRKTGLIVCLFRNERNVDKTGFCFRSFVMIKNVIDKIVADVGSCGIGNGAGDFRFGNRGNHFSNRKG